MSAASCEEQATASGSRTRRRSSKMSFRANMNNRHSTSKKTLYPKMVHADNTSFIEFTARRSSEGDQLNTQTAQGTNYFAPKSQCWLQC
jgi:hypothetical protein